MSRLEVLGYWFNPDAPAELPLPQVLVGTWAPAARDTVVAYLRAGSALVTYPEPSFCRFGCTDVAMGTRDLTDGRFVWPEGLAHYVERHGVQLPEHATAAMVQAGGVVAPFALPKPRFGLYDQEPWRRFGRAAGAVPDLTGLLVPDAAIQERIAADLGDLAYEHILLCNGATREVVLDVGGGAIELRQVKAGGAPPRRFASWLEWPRWGSQPTPPPAIPPIPGKRPGGTTFAAFFAGQQKPKD